MLPEALQGTLQQLVQFLQQVGQQPECSDLKEAGGDQRGQEITQLVRKEMVTPQPHEPSGSEKRTSSSNFQEVTPIQPDWVRSMAERVEALNQQLSEEREKTLQERVVDRQQETVLEEAIKEVQERLKRAEG